MNQVALMDVTKVVVDLSACHEGDIDGTLDLEKGIKHRINTKKNENLKFGNCM